MTVQSEVSRVSYSGDGATTAFSVNFYFLANADLRVVVRASDGTETLQTLGTDYSVTGAGNANGGTVTFTTAPASGKTIAILRDPDITQLTDYNDHDPFPADSHEKALDKLTMISQRREEKLARAILLKETSSLSNLNYPDPAAGKLLRWNSAANGIENATLQEASSAFPTDANRYIRLNAAGIPVVLTAQESSNLDEMKAINPGATGLALLADDTAADARNNLGFGDWYDVSWFGAVGDGVYVDATVTTSGVNMTAVGAAFVSGDVGKTIWVPGAGTAGAEHVTTIATVVDATNVTLTDAAPTSLSSSARTILYATNDYAAFLAARSAVPELARIMVQKGNYGISPALPSSTKQVVWDGLPGARFNVNSISNLTSGNSVLADYASARDARSFQYSGTKKQGNEANQHINWTIESTGSTAPYQKDAMLVYVLQKDPSSGLGNGDPGPNIYKDAVAGDFRAYIADGNMTGRAFGFNIYAAHQSAAAEGSLCGLEIDIVNHGVNVPSIDTSTVDFPKYGISIVSYGTNHVTQAIGILDGNVSKFYCGLYSTPSCFVDHAETRFIKLKDKWSVFKDGKTTIGKHLSDIYLPGMELLPNGGAQGSSTTGGYFEGVSTATAVNGNILAQFKGSGKNSSGTGLAWGGLSIVSSVVTAGAERTLVAIEGRVAGAYSTLAFLDGETGLTIPTANARMTVDASSGDPSFRFNRAGTLKSYIVHNGSATIHYSNATSTQGMYLNDGTSAWSAVSDARLPYKKTARPLTVLDRLDGVSLYENEVDGRLELFVKAQEFHTAFPHLVNVGSGDEDYEPTGLGDPHAWGVSYERAGVVALQGLKELREIVRQQQQMLDAL